MEFWVRLALSLGIFGLIELVDSNVAAIDSPWPLSLVVALFCSISDIIVIYAIDWMTD